MIVMRIECDCGKNTIAYPIREKYKIKDEQENYIEIYLTFVICKDCGKKYIVQIDNEETMDLLNRQRKIDIDIGTKKYRFGSSSKKIAKQENKLKIISKKLIDQRNLLSLNCNGQKYYDLDCNEIGIIECNNGDEVK